MRVAVIGAGVSGLGAARTVRSLGHEPIVFEATLKVGGRCETLTIGGYVFDSGATIFTPRGSLLESVVYNEVSTAELVVIDRPIYMHSLGRVRAVEAEKNAPPRLGYRSGIQRLPELLAEGIEVRLGTKVETVQKLAHGFRVCGEDFDSMVLTPPLTETAEILDSASDRRDFPAARYRMGISVLLGYSIPVETTYHAVLDPDQSESLTWLSVESVKVPGARAPEGHSAFVAQMSARYSRYSFESDDESVKQDAIAGIVRILGKGFESPVVSAVRRWTESHASNTVQFEVANRHANGIFLAGDGISGARIQLAYDSGVRAGAEAVRAV